MSVTDTDMDTVHQHAPRPADAPAQAGPPAIEARGLSKVYHIYDRPEDRLKQLLFRGKRYYQEFWALRGVDLTVRRGETVGIIGRNGSGKSTLLQIICGTLRPSEGGVTLNGRVSALLELGSGFDPEFTGLENVFLNGAILGLSREETNALLDDILAFADIGDHIHQPIKTYSSGMVVRLAIAVAIAVRPDILIVDEALAVGDEAFQRRCLARIEEIKRNGATILFVSHSAGQVVEICDRAVLVDHGEILFDGSPRRAVNLYHKLLYAPADKAAAFRAGLLHAWRTGAPLPDERVEPNGKDSDAPNTTSEDKAPAATGREPELDPDIVDYHNPGLVPHSTTIYESRGATLSDVRVTTPDGRLVNMLLPGRRYVIRYRLKLDAPAWMLAVGTRIKTVTGVELGGATTGRTERLIEFAEAGSEFDVAHAFECRLLEGTYFINAGVSAMVNGERLWLHRLVDAGMFQIIPMKPRFSSGPVDFDFESSLTPLGPPPPRG